MKISVSIELVGDSWTEVSGAHGHTAGQKHSFDVSFGDSVDQHEAVASALSRLLNAVNPPRLALLLAELVQGEFDINEDGPDGNSETMFARAAAKVIAKYKKMDSIKDPSGKGYEAFMEAANS